MKINRKQFFAYLLNGYGISLLIICLLIIVLPSVNDTRLINSTIASKLIYFLYGNMILLGSYSVSLLFSKEILFSFSKIDIALFVLVLYITLNRYFIQSYYGFSIRYIELLALSFLYIILRTIFFKSYPWLLLAIIVSGIIQSVYGNLQLFGYYKSNHSGFRMTGSFFNPGPYAGFLVSVWTIAFGMYLCKETITTQMQTQIKSKVQFINKSIEYTFEYIPLLGIISISVVLPALQSRASWIAALAGSGVLLELKYHFLKNTFKKVTIGFQKTALLLLTVGTLTVGLFSLYYYKKASSDGRAFIWKVTTEMIADTPVFGLGFDRFKAEYMNYQALYFAKNGETPESIVADNTFYAFNEGLQFVCENGLLGFLLLLIVLFMLFREKTIQINISEVFIAKTGLLTIGVFACFSYPMQILPIKLVLIFLVAMLSSNTIDCFQVKILSTNHSPKERGKIGISILYKLIIVLMTSITIFQTFAYTKDLSQAFIAWNDALDSHQYGDYQGAIQKFELAYPILKKDGDFLMNYGKTLSISGEPYKSIKVLKQAQHYQNNTIITTVLGDSYKTIRDYDKGELAYQQAINMSPSKFYANYLLAKLYDESGQNVKAVAMAKKLLNKEIKIPSTAIKEIQGEMIKILIKYKNPLGFIN